MMAWLFSNGMGGVMNKVKVKLLHHKEASWAHYFQRYTSIATLEAAGLIEVEIESLPQQNSSRSFAFLPEKLRRLLFFAKPDLVVTIDDGRRPITPVFALDVTEHVAARDHWIQRFPNLVGCAQEGVPGAFVAPRDMEARENFKGKTDPFFFFAYDRVMEIHSTPMYIAEWPSTNGADLDGDMYWPDLPPSTAAGIKKVFEFFDLVLDASMKGADLHALSRDRLIVELRQELRSSAYAKVPQVKDFMRLAENMPNNRLLTGGEISAWLNTKGLKLPTSVPDRIAKRSRNLVFTPVLRGTPAQKRAALLKRIHLRGGDPYTQQPLVFDYLFCRLGPTTVERDANLFIDLSVLKFSDFASYVSTTWKGSPLGETSLAKIGNDLPIYTLHLREGISQVVKNFVRLYSWSADVIVFEDGVIYF